MEEKQVKKNQSFIAMLLTVLMLLGMTACGSKEPSPSPSAPDGTQQTGQPEQNTDRKTSKDTFTWTAALGVTTLDFSASQNNATSVINSYVTNYLVDRYYEADGTISTGICDRGLASEYTFDDDSLGVTFKLREGVKFQNGTEFTAKDVVFSVNFFSDASGYEFIDYANMKADGDYTVYIPFNKVDGSALTKISVIPMWSADYWDEVGDETAFFTTKAIGTGPFMITEWVNDDHVNTDRFDGYFEGPAILSHVNYRIITENNVMLAELQTGGVDYVLRGSGNDVADVEAGLYGENVAIYKTENEDTLTLQFNGTEAIFDNLAFKQAICYAIDRESIKTAAFSDGGDDCWTVLSNRGSKLTKYEGDDWFYPYNEDTAKQKLAEAGYADTDGDGYVENENGEPMKLRLIAIGTQSIQTVTSEVLKNNLEKIGIGIDIEPMDLATWANAAMNAADTWDLVLLNLGSIESASGREYSIHDFSKNINHMEASPRYEEYYNIWISPLSQTVDEDEWMKLFRELEPKLMTDYLWWYPLEQTLDISFYNSSLQDFSRISWTTWYLKDAYFN